jgi:hypothetical protein
MLRDGILISMDGHCGNGEGLNNPDMQGVHNVGPLPRGRYKIGKWQAHPVLGVLSAALIPQPDSGGFAWLEGRGGFYIHGPELSEGCIVQLHNTRFAMSLSGDSDLEVVR